LRFTARVGELDRLYGSITGADIAAKLSEAIATDVDRRRIDLDEPIKRIGVYPIKVRLIAGLEPLINVVVEGEGGGIQLPDLEEPTADEDDTVTDPV
jgi:large subunit ribosomal protein L9